MGMGKGASCHHRLFPALGFQCHQLLAVLVAGLATANACTVWGDQLRSAKAAHLTAPWAGRSSIAHNLAPLPEAQDVALTHVSRSAHAAPQTGTIPDPYLYESRRAIKAFDRGINGGSRAPAGCYARVTDPLKSLRLGLVLHEVVSDAAETAAKWQPISTHGLPPRTAQDEAEHRGHSAKDHAEAHIGIDKIPHTAMKFQYFDQSIHGKEPNIIQELLSR